MRIIFSRDRAAQLDLLLRSIDRFMEPETTHIIWLATDSNYRKAYFEVTEQPMQPWGQFPDAVKTLLLETEEETVTFFCDDDIVFRKLPGNPGGLLLRDDRTLSFCLYLGQGNVKMSIPRGFPHWNWVDLPRHDFGFPCAVDGNTYRVKDVLRLGVDERHMNPTWLESMWSAGVVREFAEDRPMMASFQHQSLVSNPVNRVSESHGPPFGRKHPQLIKDLNARFLKGQRIDLDALDFKGIDSCHHEVKFVWK